MKKYFLNKKNIQRILLIGGKYGVAVGTLTVLFRYLLLSNTDRIQGNMLGLLIAGLILILGQYAAFRVFNDKHPKNTLLFLPTLTVGIIFSVCLGGIAGLTHYIEATYIDPEWSAKALAYAQETWASRNYSQENINGQIEWTANFQNPSLWALTTMKFLIIVSFGVTLLVATFMKMIEETTIH
ncbi:MAG: DUF4199 domain-containing protein [Saprospiraceae bacterium]